jgi:hypothetical protein
VLSDPALEAVVHWSEEAAEVGSVTSTAPEGRVVRVVDGCSDRPKEVSSGTDSSAAVVLEPNVDRDLLVVTLGPDVVVMIPGKMPTGELADEVLPLDWL